MEEEIKEPHFTENEPIVIQFVDTSMSNNLLRKYPDYSGFGFDYSQSSIWSPLVPHFSSISCLNSKSPDLSRRLSFEKITLSSKIKKKISTFGLNLTAKIQKNKSKKMLKCYNNNESSEFQSPPPKKGWKKVLKMTSKQFKKKRDHHHHHHRHPISRVTLADYLQSQNF